MINGKYHKEADTPKGRVIVDICEMYGKYEIMAMYADGEEINCNRKNTLSAAVTMWREMCKHYLPTTPTPLSGKYAKLRDDIKAALAAGKNAEAKNDDDGGTCNFDAPAIKLPRWSAEKVKQAAKEAGTDCWVWELWGSKRFVICPSTNAQANARSRNAEAMEQHLKSLSYDCISYCQAD